MIPLDLAMRLDATGDPLADPAPMRHAAVLAPLLPPLVPGEDPRLLFIERAGHLRDHAGQLAFPGGKPEPSDVDLVDTALREAEEEVALPRGQVKILGRLRPVPTPSGYVIVPFVGLVDGPWQPRWDPREVTTVITTSLRDLADPARYRFVGRKEWMGVRYALHEYDIHTPRLWGATARMVYDLLRRMELAHLDSGDDEHGPLTDD